MFPEVGWLIESGSAMKTLTLRESDHNRGWLPVDVVGSSRSLGRCRFTTPKTSRMTSAFMGLVGCRCQGSELVTGPSQPFVPCRSKHRRLSLITEIRKQVAPLSLFRNARVLPKAPSLLLSRRSVRFFLSPTESRVGHHG